MIAFEVKDMTCGHCAATITKALKSSDPGAEVTIDLAQRLVRVESNQVNERVLQDSITEAGYSPVRVAAGVVEPTSSRGSCCGHCH